MKKVLSWLLALTLLISAAVFPAAAEGAKEYAGHDISEYVTLNMFVIADAPLSQSKADEYYKVLNDYLKEKLNCGIRYVYAAGNDYTNNYMLALASGEKYDLLHAANWLDYAGYAGKGAYMPLDDLLPEYAPYVWEQAKDMWDGVKVAGKIYGIPKLRGDRVEFSFFYREDLRLKYNCPEITSMESIETYLKAIRDNEPDLIPSDDTQAMVYGNTFIPLSKYQIVDTLNGRNSNFVIDPANPHQLLNTIELPEYKEYMHTMRRFYEEGLWPKDQLSRNGWGVRSVTSGQSAASFVGQFWNYAYLVPQTEQEHPGWKLNYAPYCLMNPEESVVPAANPTGDMIAVSRTAEHAERALMLVDLAHQDEKLWMLMNYGLEGVHYTLTEDGKIDESLLADPIQDKFNYFSGALFDDPKFHKVSATEWEGQAPLQKAIEALVKPNILEGFVINFENIDIDYAALNEVRTSVGFPLAVGAMENVDEYYADYVKQSYDAGLQNCHDEIQKQLDEFLNSKGL